MELREVSVLGCAGSVRPGLISLVRNNEAVFSDDFEAWLVENVHVWLAFEREATKVVMRGRGHYSARTIIEVLRHESALSDSGVEFKINNNTAPDLARLWCLRHPSLAKLFAMRVMHSSGRAIIQ